MEAAGTMEQGASPLVVLAIFVSRFEAQIVASMLRGYGIEAFVDGEHHASVEYISLALGGHRLRIFAEDYEDASALVVASGLLQYRGEPEGRPKRLLGFLGVVALLNAAAIIPAVLAGAASLASLLWIPLAPFTVPFEPRGRPDYFLAERAI